MLNLIIWILLIWSGSFPWPSPIWWSSWRSIWRKLGINI